MNTSLLLLALSVTAGPIEPLTQWEGVAENLNDRKLAPESGAVIDAATFEKLWKAWSPKQELPEVDFRKEIVVVGTVPGPNSVLMRPSLTEGGDLRFNVGGTKKGGPGFGYRLMKLNREGIKTINGGLFDFASLSGYFASNQFEPNAAESFVFLKDQQEFDGVFGVAFVMGDKSRRLPANAFADLMVVGAIKRGNALWAYKVQGIGLKDGELEVRYEAKETKQPGATFASPLIVSIPKSEYKSVRFIENGKEVKKLTIGK